MKINIPNKGHINIIIGCNILGSKAKWFHFTRRSFVSEESTALIELKTNTICIVFLFTICTIIWMRVIYKSRMANLRYMLYTAHLSICSIHDDE